jgi:DNA-binding transcriptional regulator YiaG
MRGGANSPDERVSGPAPRRYTQPALSRESGEVGRFPMTTVPRWSGLEARALREAERLSVRAFAVRLDINDSAVSKWERRHADARLRPQTQQKLDAELAACSDDVRARFERTLREAGAPGFQDAVQSASQSIVLSEQHHFGDIVSPHDADADTPVETAPLVGALRDLLVAMRSSARLTQKQLALRIGYSRATVAGAEKLSRIPAESFWSKCDDVLAANGAMRRAYTQLADARSARARYAQRQAERAREARISAWQASADAPGPNGPKHTLDLLPSTDIERVGGLSEIDSASFTRRDALRCLCGNLIGTGAVSTCGQCGLNQRTVAALSIVTPFGSNGPDVAASLDELIEHYSRVLYSMPSVEAYRELIAGRTYAARMLDGVVSGRSRTSLTVSAGWLSNLLAIVTSLTGDHTAALIWCADAERQGHMTEHRELAGWAAVTRATIAFYQGDPHRAATAASQGQQALPIGTVPHAKLAAQEMRARSMLGEIDATEKAKQRAAESMKKLTLTPSGAAGVFSLPVSEDPPYTATSLLFMKRFQEAIYATDRVLDTTYQYVKHPDRQPPTGYARSLLILGLAYAGAGQLDEAVAAGHRALNCAPQVWPTMVLARRLDRALAQKFPGAAPASQFHQNYGRAVSIARSHVRPLPAGTEDL